MPLEELQEGGYATVKDKPYTPFLGAIFVQKYRHRILRRICFETMGALPFPGKKDSEYFTGDDIYGKCA